MLEKILAAIAVFLFIIFSIVCMMPETFTIFTDMGEFRSLISEGIHSPLNTFLTDHPFVVVIAGILFSLLVVVLPKPAKWIFLVAYIGFIIYMTLLFRPSEDSRGVFELFWSYRQFRTSSFYRIEILQNIWLFVPFGAALYSIFRRRIVILFPLIFSTVIELVQFLSGRGVAEFDDIISNTLGALVGLYIALILSRKRVAQPA